ncbi:MAG: hypothetical protein GXY74_05600 [Phycisphaerae bacterium]|nr:hypothetical protein [Phycisphaerae bacterium]
MALNWFRRKPADVEPNLQEFNAYFLMPMAADGRLAHTEETPLDIAQFVYGLDVLMERNREATEGSLREAIRAAQATPSLTDAWEPQEAWNSINRQSRGMTESQYWHVRVWLESEARRLARPFVPGPRPDRFADSCSAPAPRAAISQWIGGPMEDASSQAETSVAAQEPSAEATLPAPAVTEPSPDAPATACDRAATTKASSPRPAESFEPVLCDIPPETVEQLLREVLREADMNGPCCERAGEIVSGVERLLEGDPLPGLAFDDWRSGPANQAVVVDRLPSNADVWFIGDIHGDVLSLRVALDYLDTVSRRDLRQPYIVFLGDLFDRGHMGYQAVLCLFHELLVRGRQMCVLAGNHDEALGYREADDAFVATVSPFDLAAWLNDHREDVPRRVGRAVVRLFSSAPRAVFFPDGLLAAHGGVPLRDLAETLTCRADLDRPECLQDFVWTRAHPRARFKHINRLSRTCEFGHEDFEYFCERAALALDRPVERMIRGHDHVLHRFALYESYVRHPMLTINTLCYSQGEYGPHERMPCVARYVPGGVPQVHQLRIPGEAVCRVYPPDAGDDDAG